ncbi:MAG: helix-turn-helix domain-containing protein [Actinomycetota bacterium]|nr:helix-turn-helix domain-containing protein [Actinomycetota bacterium]
MSELLTSTDVARLLSTSREHVRVMARRGEIASVRLNAKFLRFRREDVDRFIAQHLEGINVEVARAYLEAHGQPVEIQNLAVLDRAAAVVTGGEKR